MEDCSSNQKKSTRIYEPLREKEISKIIATPTPPPPCSDLPSYPSVPFLLHPHRPLLMWCSSSAVHAYDFASNLWEAGGPQQLQPRLQHLHQLPIAAADCICLQCGARSSALCNSSRLSMQHTFLRRFISHVDICPIQKRARVVTAASPGCSSACATKSGGSDGHEAANDLTAAATVSDSSADAGVRSATSTLPAEPNTAGGTPSGCIWVTAGEDKYLHFVEVGSYKLLHSRLQRKKLSAAVFLGSSSVAPTAPSSASCKELCIAGGSKDNSLQQQDAVPVPACSSGPAREEQQHHHPAVQLLVADKFGDVYLLRDSLGAPQEQSLAGDLLTESMRTLPSVHGVRVSAAGAAGESSLNEGSSGVSGTFAVATTSAAVPARAAPAAFVVGKPVASIEEHTAAVVNSSAGLPRLAGAHLSDARAACLRPTVPTSLKTPSRSESLTTATAGCHTSGKEELLTPNKPVEKGTTSRRGSGAAVTTYPSPAQQEEATEELIGEVRTTCAGVTPHEEGGGISNPLLRSSAGGHGEINDSQRSLGNSTDAASMEIIGDVVQPQAVTGLRSAITSTADTTSDAAETTGTKHMWESQHERPDGHHEGWSEIRLQQQHVDQEEQMPKQQGEKKEDQSNTREQRFRKNAWQRERARLWRQQHLSTSATRTQQQQEVDSEMHATAHAGLHRQKDERGEGGLLENDSVDIPLLSHLTTITVMKVFPGSPTMTDDIKETDVAVTDVSVEADVGAALEHGGDFARICATAADQERHTVTSTASSGVAVVSDALSFSSGGALQSCQQASLTESITEAGTRRIPQLYRSSSGGGADLLLTADRDEKIRVCLLDQPWSIESFYLGHSEFVTDFVMIADGSACRRRGVSAVCGDCNSSDTGEDVADDEMMRYNRVAQFCQSTSNIGGARANERDDDRCRDSSKAAAACLFGNSASVDIHARKRAFVGKLGISAAADGTLQVWRVSDGAQIDELSLTLESLFHKHCRDLSHLLSCYEGVGAEEKHISSTMLHPPLSSQRLLPASLLFDEDQRLVLVQCLKLRGLLLIPVEQEETILSATSAVPTRKPLLSRQPFFIPLPVVPAAILLVYHSLDEVIHTPALTKAAGALRPLLSSSSVVHREEKRQSKQDPSRSRVDPFTDGTSHGAYHLEEEGARVTSTNQAEDHVLLPAPEAIPFVWWIDEMGRLRPPVCTSISLLQCGQHSHRQQNWQRVEANGVGVFSPAFSGKHVLPCVEGCSLDVLGTDYGASAAHANSVYFWKRTRSSACPTQAERTARRLRHKHLQQQQQQSQLPVTAKQGD